MSLYPFIRAIRRLYSIFAIQELSRGWHISVNLRRIYVMYLRSELGNHNIIDSRVRMRN